MARILVQRTNGYQSLEGERVPGYVHKFTDYTDEPAPTVVAQYRNHYVLQPEGNIKTNRRRDPNKPAYAVPSMAEINALPPNGYRVCSLFAGTGGSSLGYRMAGFKVAFANEFVEAARDSYAANAAAGTIVDGRDVRTLEPADILAATGLDEGELDVLDGSPPCASFSTAGQREKGWRKVKAYSDTAQRSDDLFFEYIRILAGLKPKVFVAENVSGLVKGVSKGYFLEILRRMKSLGYRVEARTLDAQWLGVPQARARLIFIGVRADLERDPAFPKPLPYRYSLRDALPWLDAPATEQTVEPESDMSRFAVGEEWRKLKPGQASERYFSLVRESADKPAGTVTASGGNASTAAIAHPNECRKFSIAELRRICAFPDDFVLTGSYAQQWERLGRAVPPVMMSHIAATIRDRILGSGGAR
jgi:DNA (cytosine-5)-methyltransferase 1